MSDYIKRETVIDRLSHNPGASDYLLDILADIECIPSADVAEIVRCKDCKYAMTEDCPMDELYADNYCNYGVRKEHSNEHTD